MSRSFEKRRSKLEARIRKKSTKRAAGKKSNNFFSFFFGSVNNQLLANMLG